MGNFPLSRFLTMISIISKDAKSVKCKVRNPHWLLYKRLFLLKYSYGCIKTAFSNIFENAGKSDIGLWLSSLCGSSFFNNGIIFAIFNLSGKIHVESYWFKIKVIGDNMRGQIFFISIVVILSWPQLCFELILLMILNTVSCSNNLNSSLLSILSPLIMKYGGNPFLSLHLLSNSLMGVQVCFIFDTYLLSFFLVFHTLVNHNLLIWDVCTFCL